MKYTFRDFVTWKITFTRGEFVKWQRGGIMNAWGAVFKRQSSYLFVPHYLLTKESILRLPTIPSENA